MQADHCPKDLLADRTIFCDADRADLPKSKIQGTAQTVLVISMSRALLSRNRHRSKPYRRSAWLTAANSVSQRLTSDSCSAGVVL
jgi:hypothetical protein